MVESSDLGKRTKDASGPDIEGHGKIGMEYQFTKDPAFLQERVAYWQTLYEAQKKKYAGKYCDCVTLFCRTTT